MAAIPTLSTSGWVKDLDEGGSRLLSYFMTSDGYQSNEYLGNVQSLSFLVMKYSEYPSELEREVSRALETLYTAHYGNVAVEVNVTEEDGTSIIGVKLTFTSGDEYKDLHRVLQVTDKNVITILGGR